ncbi:MAG: OmpA family protein [Acidobacteriia bacterium]|nr:OmpA family protein [Terriglobia bacterium]
MAYYLQLRFGMEGDMYRIMLSSVLAAACSFLAIAQQAAPNRESVPLYRVTVVERNVDAVNYQYRSGPTKIDFRGTVLLSNAKGNATVESKRGRTEIDAHFDNLVPPTRFGREYLSYVLWAISPEGAPHNLGEIVPDSGNHGHLQVTTDLQVFGLLVTAEPFSSVRQPSDVVVLENQVRPDTLGSTQPIRAKYELMPRGHYTYDVQKSQALDQQVSNAPKVSMREYEALLELYEAQNAVAIARSDGAEQYAPNTFAKAEHAYQEAQRLQSIKADSSLIVQNAREAAQMAEDARVLADRRKQSEQLATAQTQAETARQAKQQAEADAQQARAEADAARAQAAAAQAQVESERTAREQAEAQARNAEAQADRLQTAVINPPPPRTVASNEQKRDVRGHLLERLNAEFSTLDSPRGLIVTVNDASFSGAALRPEAAREVARVAAILAPLSGLRVAVQGYTDTAATQRLSGERAAAVRNALVSGGLATSMVSSEGLGASRPLTSNGSETGHIENRRVEIVVSGSALGSLPFWDRPYSVAPHQ